MLAASAAQTIESEQVQVPAELSLADALSLAVRLHRSGDLDQAQTVYQRILEVAPNESNALHFHGVLTHQRGDTDTALALIRRSIEIDPTMPDRYSNLGTVLAELGKLDEAAAAYREAIARAPAESQAHANAWNNLGAVLRTQENFTESAQAYEKAIELNPEHADAYNNYGNLLSIQGRVSEAVACYCNALTVSPKHAQSRKLLGLAYYTLGKIEQAAAVYREWLVDDPANPVAVHMLAACSGENVPTRASDAYVEATFDAFAESFDAKLERLSYRAPQLVADALAAACGPAAQNLDGLDAGCGTGLCGPLIRPWMRHLVGIDLSSGMLSAARNRGSYDELVQHELTNWLLDYRSAYDTIVSADTLVYFGALEEVLSAAFHALRPEGVMIFTVEKTNPGSDAAGYLINPHGRYSHSEHYLRSALAGAGFGDVLIESAALRNEGGKPVAGLLVTARKGR